MAHSKVNQYYAVVYSKQLTAPNRNISPGLHHPKEMDDTRLHPNGLDLRMPYRDRRL